MNCDRSIIARLENILSFVKKKIYPVRKPWHSCLPAVREGRVKALPFLTGFTLVKFSQSAIQSPFYNFSSS
jgi:hypothetical protein